MNRCINRIQGELIGTSRALLAIYHQQRTAVRFNADQAVHDALTEAYEAQARELKRLVNNEFQFQGNELGDEVQFALTVLLMAGEEHIASGRHSK